MKPSVSAVKAKIFVKIILQSLLLLFSTACLEQAQAIEPPQDFNPVPMQDDVIVSLPCNLHMTFRKIYTAKPNRNDGTVSFIAGDLDTSSKSAQGTRTASVTGGFKDAQGYYYLLGKYEITKRQFQSLSKANCSSLKEVSSSNIQNRIPATNISKYDFEAAARSFTNFLSKKDDAFSEYKVRKLYPVVRLPTDDEWEFAARGGLAGENEIKSDNLADFAHYLNAQLDPKPSVIGTLKPNALGLFDMLGNVQEIMSDPYAATAGGQIQGGGGGFTVRGGSFRTPSQDVKVYTRMERPLINPKTGEENRASDTGARFVIVLPINQSLNELKAKDASSAETPLRVSLNGKTSHSESFLNTIWFYVVLVVILLVLFACVWLAWHQISKTRKASCSINKSYGTSKRSEYTRELKQSASNAVQNQQNDDVLARKLTKNSSTTNNTFSDNSQCRETSHTTQSLNASLYAKFFDTKSDQGIAHKTQATRDQESASSENSPKETEDRSSQEVAQHNAEVLKKILSIESKFSKK